MHRSSKNLLVKNHVEITKEFSFSSSIDFLRMDFQSSLEEAGTSDESYQLPSTGMRHDSQQPIVQAAIDEANKMGGPGTPGELIPHPAGGGGGAKKLMDQSSLMISAPVGGGVVFKGVKMNREDMLTGNRPQNIPDYLEEAFLTELMLTEGESSPEIRRDQLGIMMKKWERANQTVRSNQLARSTILEPSD